MQHLRLSYFHGVRRLTFTIAILCFFLAVSGRTQTPLTLTTSWIGNTLSRSSSSVPYTYLQNGIESIYVAPDGTVYAHSQWDEGGKPAGIYKNGHTIGQCAGVGMEAPCGITGDGTYVYSTSFSGSDYGVQRNNLDGTCELTAAASVTCR